MQKKTERNYTNGRTKNNKPMDEQELQQAEAEVQEETVEVKEETTE